MSPKLLFLAVAMVALAAETSSLAEPAQESSGVSPANSQSSTDLSHKEIKKREKIYRVGGDVAAPQVIAAPKPVLQKTGGANPANVKEGTAILAIVVDEKGNVESAKIVRSLRRDLDAAALDVVRQWKFAPATKKGIPVAVALNVEVTFHPSK